MNIIITDIANITWYVIPIVPSNVSIKSITDNKEEDTLREHINIAQNKKLRTIEWSSFFPVNKNYSFVRANSLRNGWAYVTFLELMRTLRLPIRIVCTTDTANIPIINMSVTIDELEISPDKVGDINYSIKLKEFPEGFFDFLDREEEALVYIREILTGQRNVRNLRQAGLLMLRRDYDNVLSTIQN